MHFSSPSLKQLIRDPKYNPEAAKHHRVPQDAAALRLGGGTHMCLTCCSYRPIHDFRVLSNSDSAGKCLVCIERDNIAHPRIDYGFYGVLLRQLRTAEEKFDDDSRICHLLKVREKQTGIRTDGQIDTAHMSVYWSVIMT